MQSTHLLVVVVERAMVPADLPPMRPDWCFCSTRIVGNVAKGSGDGAPARLRDVDEGETASADDDHNNHARRTKSSEMLSGLVAPWK